MPLLANPVGKAAVEHASQLSKKAENLGMLSLTQRRSFSSSRSISDLVSNTDFLYQLELETDRLSLEYSYELSGHSFRTVYENLSRIIDPKFFCLTRDLKKLKKLTEKALASTDHLIQITDSILSEQMGPSRILSYDEAERFQTFKIQEKLLKRANGMSVLVLNILDEILSLHKGSLAESDRKNLSDIRDAIVLNYVSFSKIEDHSLTQFVKHIETEKIKSEEIALKSLQNDLVNITYLHGSFIEMVWLNRRIKKAAIQVASTRNRLSFFNLDLQKFKHNNQIIEQKLLSMTHL